MSIFQSLVPIIKLPFNRLLLLVGVTVLIATACSRQAPAPAPPKVPAYYTCPMHPFVRSQDPDGKCPICGMNLVPVQKGEAPATPDHHDETNAPAAAAPEEPMPSNTTVLIEPARLKEIGATTEVVTKRNLTRPLRAPARAEIDESSLQDVNVKAGGGYITKLYANYVGMSFKKGQPLMTVLCEGWLQTQIDYIKSYRDWKRSPLLEPNNSFALNNKLALMRARIRVWDLSEDQIRNLEKFALSTNEIDLRTGHGLSGSFDVRAPFDGYVHVKKAIEGMRFEAGQSLLELAGHGHVWIVAEFPEDQAPFINVGQKMTVSFPSMPSHKIMGEVSFLDPHIDEQQRRVRVRIIIRDEGNMFHPGLFAQVTGEAPMGERLSVSAGAVVPTGTKYLVFVDHGNGRLEPREIEIGARSGDYDEVLSGLKEGERVVASANFLIDAESRIQGVLKTWGTHP